MDEAVDSLTENSKARVVAAVFLAWVAVIGFDFLLHAGVLRDLYDAPSDFLLPLESAFRRIPLGYLAFLLLTVLMAWLMRAARVSGAAGGFRFGMLFGVLTWGAWGLALASISTAPANLLIAWFVGQSLEAGLTGAVIGAAFAANSLRRLAAYVAGLFLLCVITAIVLQNFAALQDF